MFKRSTRHEKFYFLELISFKLNETSFNLVLPSLRKQYCFCSVSCVVATIELQRFFIASFVIFGHKINLSVYQT